MSKQPIRAPQARTYEQGVANERARIAAILDSDEAQQRPALARKLALTTNLSDRQAAEILTAAPKEASPFLDAMKSEAIGITPELAFGPGGTGDERSRRFAELKESMQAYNESRGYTQPRRRREDY